MRRRSLLDSSNGTDNSVTISFVLNQNISDPTKMLTGPLGKDGTPKNNVIS